MLREEKLLLLGNNEDLKCEIETSRRQAAAATCTGIVEPWENLLDIQSPVFLIEATSVHTKEKLKSYKSLDGYNFFSSGLFTRVTVHVKDTISNQQICHKRKASYSITYACVF